ncbi:MAG: CotH kinase family protein [Bythopirellula sp.]
MPFNVADASAVSTLTLKMKYDDGFAAYINGVRLNAATANAPDPLLWNSTATLDHNDVDAIDFEDFDITAQKGLLQDGANVLAIHGLNTFSGSSDMLITPELVAGQFSLLEPFEEGYFASATPGLVNSDSFQGFVADTTFSVDRGLYDSPFTVDITTATPGATISYTANGTVPTLTNGTLVLAPDPNTPPVATVFVDGTGDGVVTLRAAAFKDDFAPTNVDTQTYVFLDDVIANQTERAGTPAGFPANNAINGKDMDFGFAADIYNHATWGPQLRPALEALPSLSMVTDPDNLFNSSSGIYVNTGGSGKAWERPASLELINPDGSAGFQVETGVRIRGNFSLSSSNPKNAFRLFFRDEYGDAKLKFPLFGAEGVDEFDKLDLRTFQNDSWAWQGSDELTMIHDVFSRDTQRDMGQSYTRSRYYHLYINGQYWGIYQTQERAEAAYGASYFGGDRDDYDTIKAAGGSQSYVTEATDGDMDGAWRDLWDLVNLIENETDPTANYALYMQAQGMNPDGTRNLAFPVLLDVDNLIDYMNVIFYTSDEDAPLSRPLSNNRSNNWFGLRNRNGEEGFRFYAHDAEQTMISKHNVDGLQGDRTGPFNNSNKGNFTYSNPQWLHEDLMEGSEEYRIRFGDRVQKHYFNGGALSVAAVTARFDTRAAELDAAVVAQSARWGNGAGQNPSFDKNTWLAALDSMRNNYFQASPQNRGQIVLEQLRDDALYPNLDAVAFSQQGGSVPSSFQLAMSVVPVGVASSGDFDGDLDTDVDDYAILTDTANWLQAVPPGTRGDMDGDGFVQLNDFSLFKGVLNGEMLPIYFTLDGVTDPREVGGTLNSNPAVMLYAGTPITINADTTVKARAWDGSSWSALSEVAFTIQSLEANSSAIAEDQHEPLATADEVESAFSLLASTEPIFETKVSNEKSLLTEGDRLLEAVDVVRETTSPLTIGTWVLNRYDYLRSVEKLEARHPYVSEDSRNIIDTAFADQVFGSPNLFTRDPAAMLNRETLPADDHTKQKVATIELASQLETELDPIELVWQIQGMEGS